VLERNPMPFLGCCLHGWVKWVVNEECHLTRGLVGVHWSEMVEVGDGEVVEEGSEGRRDIQRA